MDELPESLNERCTICEKWGDIRFRGWFRVNKAPYRLCRDCAWFLNIVPDELVEECWRRLLQRAVLAHCKPMGNA